MATPTTDEFWGAARHTYGTTPLPDDLVPYPIGNPLDQTIIADGFHAELTKNIDTGDYIIAFEGTDPTLQTINSPFLRAQLAADAQIYLGQVPDAYNDALEFTNTVLALLAEPENGSVSADHVFVTGHSLGGAEAEYVAAKTGLGGEAFGAPGIPAGLIPDPAPHNFENFVEYGDPVGNYSANPNYEGGFLHSDQIHRYGDVTYIGNSSDRDALREAGEDFGPGTSPLQNARGVALLTRALQHHLPGAYAHDLPDTDGSMASASPDSALDNLTHQLAQSLVSSDQNVSGAFQLIERGALLPSRLSFGTGHHALAHIEPSSSTDLLLHGLQSTDADSLGSFLAHHL